MSSAPALAPPPPVTPPMNRPSPAQLATTAALLCAAAALVIGLAPRDVASPAAPAAEPFRAWAAAEAPAEQPEPIEEAADEEVAVIDQRPVEPLIGQSRAARSKAPPKLKPAILVIVTDFDKVDVTVNGAPYPEFVPEDGQRGMVLPAGGPHIVVASAGDKSKVYEIGLGAYETRYIVIEPSVLASGTAAPKIPPPPQTPMLPPAARNEKAPEPIIDPSSDVGKVTVYAKPPGEIFVDDKPFGQKTPYTVDVDEGRHELQVRYEGGAMSEKKIVRARKGSRIKLFFRQAE